MAERNLNGYSLAVEAYRALLRLRVHLCPTASRELLRETLHSEITIAIDEATLGGLKDGGPE